MLFRPTTERSRLFAPEFYARLRASLLVGLTLVAGSAAAQVTVPTPAPPPDPTEQLFDDSVVHDVRLVINSNDWNTLKTNFLDNFYYPTNMTIDSFSTVQNIGIRSRGTGSRSPIKPGLRLDFDRFATSQTFLGLKSLILRNQTQDPSNLHERLSMLFFKRMGLVASREAHARLYVNNEYVGLYTLVESVDKAFLQRHFGENDGQLYKYDYARTDTPYYFEFRGTDPALYSPKPFKPETHEDNPNNTPLELMIRTLNTIPDALFQSAMAEYLDLSLFVRHTAIEVFLAEQDGILGNWGMNNFYLYRFLNGKSQFIVYDKSNTFIDGPQYPIFHNINDVPPEARNRLMVKALAVPELRDLFLQTLLDCAVSASLPDVEASPQPAPAALVPQPGAGWLEREIIREYNQIQDWALADPSKPFTNEEFEASIQQLLDFAQNRSAFVTAAVAQAKLQP